MRKSPDVLGQPGSGPTSLPIQHDVRLL
ncbi:unnamed protein product [Spirodela intermedia]|uniref:Uncharacterized protein n=1 Tax=Spirodela intermedia TaxID=51605 RepID=A0A7I8IRA6_SPIIN|nr:unnamed protein product [Spirodela intermedia]CAA6660492.1 unnamed protein product [Spirodela intermedia]